MKEFGEVDTIFENREVLKPYKDTYTPEKMPEREEELNRLHSALRPVVLESSPDNVLVYGHSGQGKTAAIKLKTEQLQNYANEHGIDLSVVRVNCEGAGSSYKVITRTLKELREVRHGPGEELVSGYHKKDLLDMITTEMEEIGGTIILVFDEIDEIGDDDYILYELSRTSVPGVKYSVIGVTNNMQFRQNLDADVRSSLGEDEIIFDHYGADALRNILARRSVKALRDTHFDGDAEVSENLVSDVLTDATIPYCAAQAASNTGDAREAIRILYHATRMVDDSGGDTVSEDHIDQAVAEIEREAIQSHIKTLPNQKMLALLTVAWFEVHGQGHAKTKPAYQRYKSFCEMTDQKVHVQRSFRDRLNDLADTNLIDKTRGHGRGNHNRYSLAISVDSVLENSHRDGEPLWEVTRVLLGDREETGQSTL